LLAGVPVRDDTQRHAVINSGGYWPKCKEPRGLAGAHLAAAIDDAEASEDQ
jgi:hypothetical protein